MLVADVKFIPVSSFGGVVAEYKMVLILEDGSEEPLGRFFTDEKSYSAENFKGLTAEQARQKFIDDDIAYLRS